MSHTTAIKAIKIVDTDALRRAVADLNAAGIKCSLTENQKPRAFYADQAGLGIAPFVLHLEDCPYDVGFYPSGKTDNGQTAYEARTDFWMGHVERILSSAAATPETREQARMGRLFQAYAVCATENFLTEQGRSFERQTVNGEVQLIATY